MSESSKKVIIAEDHASSVMYLAVLMSAYITQSLAGDLLPGQDEDILADSV
jgi:hypothetical protein